MENLNVKFKAYQRDYLLNKILSASPVQENTIKSHLLLKEKLTNGSLFDNEQSLSNYVELNSVVAIKSSLGFKYGLKLVIPEEGDIQANKLSVLSSMGCAVFGQKEGEIVKWYFKGRAEYAEIIRVSKHSNENVLFSTSSSNLKNKIHSNS